jgi:hypothetical protein
MRKVGGSSVSLRPILSAIISGFRLSKGKKIKSTTPKKVKAKPVRPVRKARPAIKAIKKMTAKTAKTVKTVKTVKMKMKMKGGAQADFFE